MIIITQSPATSILWADLFWMTEKNPRALSLAKAEHKGIVITKHLDTVC